PGHGQGRPRRRALLHDARRGREHADRRWAPDVPEAEIDLGAARPGDGRPARPEHAQAAGHVPDVPARTAPRGPLRQPSLLPAAHGDPAPREPGDRAQQGERRPDRGDADQLTPITAGGDRVTSMADETEEQQGAETQAGEDTGAWPDAAADEGGSERILNQD